jgi:hypothetical protein
MYCKKNTGKCINLCKLKTLDPDPQFEYGYRSQFFGRIREDSDLKNADQTG